MKFYCVDCGCDYGPPFIWTPDEIWDRMGYKKDDFACAVCMAKKLLLLTDQWIWHIVPGTGLHKIDACRVTIDSKQETNTKLKQ